MSTLVDSTQASVRARLLPFPASPGPQTRSPGPSASASGSMADTERAIDGTGRQDSPDTPAPVLIPLDRLPLRRAGRIIRLDGDSRRLDTLREMGLWEHARVLPVRRAPLGDPLEVRVFGCHLALRREDARSIWVEMLPDGAR